jgi:hypothetical protein
MEHNGTKTSGTKDFKPASDTNREKKEGKEPVSDSKGENKKPAGAEFVDKSDGKDTKDMHFS